MVDFIGPPVLPAYSDPDMARGATSYVPATGGVTGNMKTFAEDDGPSFKDLIDIINPLQHIPLVNTIYQHLTGDKESAAADLIGGALYGGVVGLGAAIVNLIIEDKTGKNASDNVLAWMGVDDDATTKLADGQSSPAAAAGSAARSAAAGQAPDAATAPGGSAAAMAAAVGNYMVFGGTAPAPAASSSSDKPLSLLEAPGPAAAQPAATGAADGQAEAARSDPFMVFGGPVSTTLPRTSTAAAARSGAAVPSSSSSSGTAPAAAPAREFPVPPRRAITPRQTLPPPTTGRAAVPGQALNNQTQESGSWFVGAFNQAMDKYDKASRLATPPAVSETAAAAAN